MASVPLKTSVIPIFSLDNKTGKEQILTLTYSRCTNNTSV